MRKIIEGLIDEASKVEKGYYLPLTGKEFDALYIGLALGGRSKVGVDTSQRTGAFVKASDFSKLHPDAVREIKKKGQSGTFDFSKDRFSKED